MFLELFFWLTFMSDRELCHFTSKSIGDGEDTLKYFMAFNITPDGPVFRMVVRSQIVVLPTISLSQWHSCNLNPWPWFWYHLSDRELYHSTSKPIGNKEYTIKFFMVFNITSHEHVVRVIVRNQIVVFPTTHIELKMIRDYLQCYIYVSVTRNVLRN